MRSTPLKILLPCLAFVLASAGNARADLQIALAEDGGPATVVYDGPSNGSSGPLNGIFTAAPDFLFNDLSATSFFGSPSTLGTDDSIIALSPGSHSLTILISDNEYNVPAGPNYVMGSSSGYTAASDPGGTATFQSFATPGMVPTGLPFGMAIGSPGAVYTPINLSGSSTEASTNFSAPGRYTLTEEITWTPSTSGSIFDVTGSTTVSAVPEPSSLVLFGLGSIGMIALRLRRRA